MGVLAGRALSGTRVMQVPEGETSAQMSSVPTSYMKRPPEVPKVVPPGLTAFHAAGVYLSLYGSATSVMSVSRPSAAKVARFIPSIFDRHGAVPAFTAARSFWYAVSPAGLTNLIRVSGWSLFHVLVWASMPSVQLHNSSVTLPLVAFAVESEPAPPPPQAASMRDRDAAAAAEARALARNWDIGPPRTEQDGAWGGGTGASAIRQGGATDGVALPE